jgi:hypothetical protein
MTDKPIRFIWDGEALRPDGMHFLRLCLKEFGEGEEVTMQRYEPRSMASHNHYFAQIGEAWQNLPDHLLERFPTAEHLRKYALIKAGYADHRSITCSSKAEAQRLAAFIKPMDEYALITVNDATVFVFTAQSQSMRAMGKEKFQASKDAVLTVISDIIGVSTDELERGTDHA